MVTASKNTVHSVFFLILDFISISCLFIMIGAEFLGMIMLIVYVGAVAVLFLFVVMMLNVAQQKNQWFSSDTSSRHIPVGLIISAIIFFELIIVIGGWKYKPDLVNSINSSINSEITNTHSLGLVLYTDYIHIFQISGMILLIAMIGAIVLTYRQREGVKKQSYVKQISRERSEGVKVVDFMWSLAGPFTTRALADLGATVVKIESTHKPDAARGFLPVWDNEPGLERSALFDTANAGKLSLALNMNRPEALEVMHDLIGWADVLCDSFSPGKMDSWGLSWEKVQGLNPRLIMLSTCLTGQSGPTANFAGYGNLGAALSGFYGLAGWPDRAPSGPFGAYTDYTSTHFMLTTLLAALDKQRRTGSGEDIALAQTEAALHFIAPAVLEASATGRLATAIGNDDSDMSPQKPTGNHAS